MLNMSSFVELPNEAGGTLGLSVVLNNGFDGQSAKSASPVIWNWLWLSSFLPKEEATFI